MEMWAGFECTLNRVGDRFQDQLLPTERAMRSACLKSLPALGVTAFRYRIAWDDVATPWEAVTEDIASLTSQNIKPIIGLLHHGSGPRDTSLIDDNFVAGMAAHARAVARKLPTIEYWTPINEPLTTARFSALYGHWYPHHSNEVSFWNALLNQTEATIAAMREIRRVNPEAKLIQTEDLGITYATAAMSDQAAYDNQRRWMTWDLLCGLVGPNHSFYDGLCELGFKDQLDRIASAPCPPDVIGVNHYLTSDRFLDHRIERYPVHSIGTNGRRDFADVEAVRVLSAPTNGLKAALSEAWERYKIPVALTECHNGCTREEQMRWVRDAWHNAEALNAAGASIVAVTIWTLMGARGWCNLLTQEFVDFEGGVFDPRGGTIRPTGLAETIKCLAHNTALPAAVSGPGWWQREDRLKFPPAHVARPVTRTHNNAPNAPLLIAGITGSLGQALTRAAKHRGLRIVTTSRSQLALDDCSSIDAALKKYNPWAVINATGWVKVDEAEGAYDSCMSANALGALRLAQCCEARGIPNAHFSSDLVFDGKSDTPYSEYAATSPLSVYGESKAIADAALLEMSTPLVVRTAAFFSPFDRFNFAHQLFATVKTGETFLASPDHMISPTYVPHLADIVLDLIIDRAHGLYHISNGETLNWLQFAHEISAACDLNPRYIGAASAEEMGWIAPRPAQSGLRSIHGQIVPTLNQAISAFANHMHMM
jgi:dTDP-4-dehydrorhamnose reductase